MATQFTPPLPRRLTPEEADLAIGWLLRFGVDELGVTSHAPELAANSQWTMTMESGASITVLPPGRRALVFQTDDDAVAARLRTLASEAVTRALSHDYGALIWWTAG